MNIRRYFSFLLFGIILLITSLLVACGQPAPPVIVEFSAAPAQISAGEAATLTWHVTGATTLSIDQGIGDVDTSGTKEVSPTTTTAYTLTATNAAGTVSKPIVITILNTYTNDIWGYVISYPDDWVVDESPLLVIVKFRPPPQYSGEILVGRPPLDAGSLRDLAFEWLEVLNMDWHSITVLDNCEMQGKWDWYVSFDGTMDEHGKEVHGEVRYKQEGSSSFMVQVFFEKANYYVCPLTEILETFEMTTLSWSWYSDKALSISSSVTEALNTLSGTIDSLEPSETSDIAEEVATSFTNEIVIYQKQWEEIVPPKAFVNWHTCYADSLIEVEQVGISYASLYASAHNDVDWARAFMKMLEAMKHYNDCLSLRQEIFEIQASNPEQLPHYGCSSPPT